ncbi:MAG: VOC family protein [Alphaproteobacteria bacterium]
MEQRLSIITIGVSDLKKARAFYDSLGWKIASDAQAEEIIAYDLISMTLCLYPIEKLAKDANIEIQKQQYSTTTIAYNVRNEAEVDTTLDEVKKAGGTIIKPAQKAFWGGYSGYFADPDGNLWEVAFNPHAPLGQNGEFQWNGAV